MPAHADQRRVVHRPLPIDAKINRVSVRPDSVLRWIRAREIRLAEKNAAQQQRGIYGRELHLLEAIASLHVEEVIEKSLVARDVRGLRTLRRVVHEAQRVESALRRVSSRDVPPLDPNRIRGEGETDRGDAGKTIRR